MWNKGQKTYYLSTTCRLILKPCEVLKRYFDIIIFYNLNFLIL